MNIFDFINFCFWPPVRCNTNITRLTLPTAYMINPTNRSNEPPKRTFCELAGISFTACFIQQLRKPVPALCYIYCKNIWDWSRLFEDPKNNLCMKLKATQNLKNLSDIYFKKHAVSLSEKGDSCRYRLAISLMRKSACQRVLIGISSISQNQSGLSNAI